MTTTIEATREEILEFVRSQIAEVKGLDELTIPNDAPLFDLEGAEPDAQVLDSLDALELSVALEEHFHVSLPEEVDVTNLQSIDAIVSFIEARLHAQPA